VDARPPVASVGGDHPGGFALLMWLAVGLLVAATCAILAWRLLRRPSRPQLSAGEHEQFAQRLRQALAAREADAL
jgi:hypothetical protein